MDSLNRRRFLGITAVAATGGLDATEALAAGPEALQDSPRAALERQLRYRLGPSTAELPFEARVDLALTDLLSTAPVLVNARGYGAVGDGVADDTLAIQAALDAASTRRIGSRTQASTIVHLPQGHYRAAQLRIPLGVSLEGVGMTTAGDAFGTLIQQVAGANTDLLVFESSAVSDFTNNCHIRRLGLLGNEGDTRGSAIKFAEPNGGEASPAQQVRIQHVTIRNFPEHGIHIAHRVFPFRARDLFIWDCDGYGVYFVADNVNGLFHLDGIDFDDNTAGAVYYDNTAGSARDVLLFTSLKIEKSSDGRQEDGIVLRNGNACTVHLQGVVHYKGGGASRDPNSVLRLEGESAPSTITWSGCEARNPETGMVVDDVHGVRVPEGHSNGVYRPTSRGGAVAFGRSPSTWLYEVGAGEGEKVTEIMQTGGDFRIRALDDEGGSPSNLLIADRSGAGWESLRLLSDVRHEGRVRHARRVLTPGVEAPSVREGSYFTTDNPEFTRITFFSDGVVGQELVVEFGDDNTVVDFGSPQLLGNLGQAWVPVTGDHMRCVFNGNAWLCDISRNS